MIQLSKVSAVFVKECRDVFRDKRTLFATIALPVLMWPLMTLLMTELLQYTQGKAQSETYAVAVEPAADHDAIAAWLEPHLKPRPVEKADEEAGPKEAAKSTDRPHLQELPAPRIEFVADADPLTSLREGRIQAVLRLQPGLLQGFAEPENWRLKADETPELEILYDEAEHRSARAERLVRAALVRAAEALVAGRLERQELGEAFLVPFRVAEPTNVAPPEKVGGSRLGTMLPLWFIFMLITGALGPAIDLTVGEKERKTLIPLIVSPVQPMDAMLGKFLCVSAVALLNAFLNVSSFALTIAATGLHRIEGFQFPWSALPATLLLLLPLALLFSAVMLAVSSLATNYKEAQVYILPVYILPLFALLIAAVPDLELAGPLLVLPVANTSLLIRELFLGREGLGQAFAFVFSSTCLYAGAAVLLASKIFAREEVLFGSQSSLRLLLGRRYLRPRPTTGVADGLVLAALAFPLWFYCSTTLQQTLLGDLATPGAAPASWRLALGLFAPLLVLLAVPWFAVWYMKLTPRETFGYRLPGPRAWASALCLGGSSWVLGLQYNALAQHLGWIKHSPLGDLLEPIVAEWPLAMSLALMAALPAICEEHLCRGMLLNSFRATGRRTLALVATALLFGAFHLPLVRQPLAASLGLALGLLAWESRSLWPSVLFHFLHNGLSVLVAREAWIGEIEGPWLPASLLAPALAVFALGTYLAFGCGKTDPESAATAHEIPGSNPGAQRESLT